MILFNPNAFSLNFLQKFNFKDVDVFDESFLMKYKK